MPHDTSLRNTLIFLAIFIVAFFPPAFQYLLKPLLSPLAIFGLDFNAPELQQLPTCGCCPPSICFPSSFPPPNPLPTTVPTSPTPKMSFTQKTFTLPSRTRGSYLITSDVEAALPEIKDYTTGILHLFLQHTSAALSLNENWDEEVREDMSDALDRIVPEDKKGNLYRHSAEGADDMPAHVKSALIGASVSVPITGGKLNTGTWQGIWFLEFRRARHSRKVVATIQGEKRK